jgi:two-component system response regulator CpxR
MIPRISFIDDDVVLGSLMVESFAAYGMLCDPHTSGEAALTQLRTIQYDLVILDVMMPGMDGFEVLRRIRFFSSIPVIMLTARGNPRDVVMGFQLGADDYLAKPFNDEVLVARILAILRRSAPASFAGPSRDILILGGLEVNRLSRQVFVDSQAVGLTLAEFEVFSQLAFSLGQVVSRDDLCRAALGRSLHPMDRGVDNLVLSLRKKLALAGCTYCEIRSARGVGYILTGRG